MSSIKLLKQIQSDSLVMFNKLHNFHWNVKGLQFYGLHAKTEEFYTYFATMYDDVAERILQLGEKPIVTLKDVMERAQIKEDSQTNFTVEYVVENVIKDFNYFLNAFSELSSLSENDAPTQAYADEQIGFFQKEIWMLKSLIG